MATLEDNKNMWELDVVWKYGGEQWSMAWGGPRMQWYGSIMPRIHRYIPANTILEIGSGYGRFSQFLKDYAENLILVDISEKGIEACKSRFSDEKHIYCFVNDGKSLDMIHDNSVDFIFTHDALVFVEEDVMAEYIRQFAKKLTKDGVAFIHHSNLGAYWSFSNLSHKTTKLLQKINILEEDHWRARSVSAEKVKEMCHEFGLESITQEPVVYFTKKTFVDCYSVLVHKDSKWFQEPKIFRNRSFMKEAENLRRLSKYYGLPYEKRSNKPINDLEVLNEKIKSGEVYNI